MQGTIDGRLTTIQGTQLYSFSWEGSDEMDDANGGGWISLLKNKTIIGQICFHFGDDYEFEAVRA